MELPPIPWRLTGSILAYVNFVTACFGHVQQICTILVLFIEAVGARHGHAPLAPVQKGDRGRALHRPQYQRKGGSGDALQTECPAAVWSVLRATFDPACAEGSSPAPVNHVPAKAQSAADPRSEKICLGPPFHPCAIRTDEDLGELTVTCTCGTSIPATQGEQPSRCLVASDGSPSRQVPGLDQSQQAAKLSPMDRRPIEPIEQDGHPDRPAQDGALTDIKPEPALAL